MNDKRILFIAGEIIRKIKADSKNKIHLFLIPLIFMDRRDHQEWLGGGGMGQWESLYLGCIYVANSGDWIRILAILEIRFVEISTESNGVRTWKIGEKCPILSMLQNDALL